MKTKLALLSMVAASAAHSQSSVAISGVLGLGLSSLSGAQRGTSNFNAGHLTLMAQDTKVPTRLVFRGSEDMGGGLAAIFLIDKGLNLDDGTDTLGGAARETYVGLKSNYGTVTLGRQFHPLFNVRDNFDPTADSSNVMATAAFRMNNSIMYRTPTVAGWFGKVAYGFGESAAGSAASRATGAHIGYDRGPFSTMIGFNRLNDSVAIGHASNYLWSGSYDFGPVAGFVEFGINKGFVSATGAYSSADSTDLLLGARVPYGSHTVSLTYIMKNDKLASDADARQAQLLYIYRLSKRTVLYGVATKIWNLNGAAFTTAHAPSTPTPAQFTNGARPYTQELSLGIRHNF